MSLQDVLVAGGGQNDLWHNLGCRGKYAGEIRIEITYYDSRPKPSKPSDKIRQSAENGLGDDARDSMTGPRQPKPPVKRRPLPSDPTTVSPAPAATQETVQTQSRGHQIPPTCVQIQSPLQAIEHDMSSLRFSQSQQSNKQGLANMHNHDAPTTKSVNTAPGRPMQDNGHDSYGAGSGIEYGRETVFRHGDLTDNQRDMRPRYEESMQERRPQRSRYDEPIEEQSRDLRSLYKDIDGQRRDPRPLYDEPIDDQRKASRPLYEDTFDVHGARRVTYEVKHDLPAPNEYESPPSPGGPPPPPPVHRSNIASWAASNVPTSNGNYDSSSFNGTRNTPFEPPRQEDYLSSTPAYSQNNMYQGYTRNGTQGPAEYCEDNGSYQQYHAYSDEYNGSYGALQSTVGDLTIQPTSYHQPSHNASVSHDSQYQDRRYDDVLSPAPLNLSGRRSAASELNGLSAPVTQQFYTGTPSTVSPLSYRDSSQIGSEVSSRTSYSRTSQQSQNMGRESRDDMRRLSGSFMPSVPPTLVAGMDPIIAQEVSERIYHENRASYIQNAAAEHRGRYPDRTHHRPSYSHPAIEHKAPLAITAANFAPTTSPTVVPFTPEAAGYDDQQDSTPSSAHNPIVKPRAISPNPKMPARKSISPSPRPSSQGRRLSGFPYGPDAYDVLNPNVAPSVTKTIVSARSDQQDIGANAKIIMHDGREVDPSDHLPETSWAPEPEIRTPKQPDGGRSQPSPTGAPSMTPSSRRPLHREGRSQSFVPVSSPSMYMSGAVSNPTTPALPSHNRLQKKSNRNSIQPASHSSPLTSLTSYSENNYSARSLPRAQTVDFAGEDRYNPYSGSPGGYGRDAGCGNNGRPPVPAKVPLNHSRPPSPPTENAWTLQQEIKSIDIGSGRARRRNTDHNVFL